MHKKRVKNFSRPPKSVWLGIAFASLSSPLLHFIRWFLTPDEYTYYFFLNQDLADWLYILQSPNNNFLSIHDVEKDISIWLRPDAHSLILLPVGIIGKWMSIPSPFLLIAIDITGNFCCAYATYFFFKTFLDEEQKVVAAFYLVYFSSGIAGLIVLLRWIILGDFTLAMAGWAGENHSLSYELMEGNMVSWSTILFRPYYVIPRALGLLSIALLYRASQMELAAKEKSFSALCIFLATLIHPQSGLIYGAMAALFMLFLMLREREIFLKKINPALWTLGGFGSAAILWKLYQRIPDVNEAVIEYLKRMYNADSVPLLFAIATLLVPTMLIILRKTREKIFVGLIMLVGVIYSISVSEWIIRDYNVGLRVILITLSIIIFGAAVIWKREWLIESLRKAYLETVFAVWVFVIIIVALSPHHDGIKMIKQGAIDFALMDAPVQAVLSALSVIYAAPFRLGIVIPLSALCVMMIWQVNEKLRQLVLMTIFFVSLGSLSLYYAGIIDSTAGRLSFSEKKAMEFLRTLPKKNVLCSSRTSQFIIQISMKKTLVGGIAGVLNLDERLKDLEALFTSDDKLEQQRLIKKYRLDYLYLSPAEKEIGATEARFSSYKKIYDQDDVMIFELRQEMDDEQSNKTEKRQ